MSRYVTRDDAIQREIITAIAAGETGLVEFDIDAIADTVLGVDDDGHWTITVNEEEFWNVVADTARGISDI
jgi:hypothetical protein